MNWVREMFLGTNGRLSSKRAVGAFCVIVATIVICYLAITDPIFPAINSLMEFVLITGGALLGIGIAEKRWNNKDKEENIS